MGQIFIVGIGPGDQSMMTFQATECLKSVDLIVGYTGYVKLLGPDFDNIEKLSTGMRGEVERCRLCIEQADLGKNVAMICSGDSGVYGMASLIYQLSSGKSQISVIPGLTAAISGAAVLGAPINHDFCTISLSDLLTPWALIEKRLLAAAEGDFVISLYNPASHKRTDYLQRACEILLTRLPGERPCGYIKNIGREKTQIWTGNLFELKQQTVDMFTTCFIGNSKTFIKDSKLITPRGYILK